MASRIHLRSIAGRSVAPSVRSRTRPSLSTPACLFCALAPTSRAASFARRSSRRFQSTVVSSPSDPRKELVDTLLELQKHAPSYINLSRLQLALQGLRQSPGQESIRVAILGLANGGEAGKTAKDLLRLLLADPLASEQPWEAQIAAHDPRQPLVVRIRQPQQRDDDDAGRLTISKTNLLHELEVSRPGLNGLNLEFLLTEVSPLAGGAAGDQGAVDSEEAVLVPTVDIPSNTGRFNPITTPVHRALVVTRGLMGAATVASLPVLQNREAVLAAVDLPGYAAQRDAQATFQPIDVAAGGKGVDLFRDDIGNAMEFERLWNGSNIPALVSWLKTGAEADDGLTKPALRQLIASLLQNTSAAIEEEESRQLGGLLSTAAATAPGSVALNRGLAAWSQEAHEELQQQLDLAFAGRRWRKLGWWKLFWRVDDVGHLTSEILSQRFLPGAERELVYLAGRIEQAGVAAGANGAPVYAQPLPESEQPATAETAQKITTSPADVAKWPTHIAFTRRYLHSETVPALQALAQKLVLQASSTSALTTSLAALVYMSASATTLYEAGAVAALGIVWSLRRLQTKWETAREFWEGEVREEGRKAVRGAEASVAAALDGEATGAERADDALEERQLARQLTDKAADALSRMK